MATRGVEIAFAFESAFQETEMKWKWKTFQFLARSRKRMAEPSLSPLRRTLYAHILDKLIEKSGKVEFPDRKGEPMRKGQEELLKRAEKSGLTEAQIHALSDESATLHELSCIFLYFSSIRNSR